MIAIASLWIPLLLVLAICYGVFSASLYLTVWLTWLPRGRHIFFVYSDSPIWHDYLEQHVLPTIRDRAIILNWTQRSGRSWRRSFPVAVFKHFGGWREFNPMGVVFYPFRRARVFRFFQPFRKFKHGEPETLAALQKEFLQYSGLHAIQTDAPL
jgi:hypothetical protein